MGHLIIQKKGIKRGYFMRPNWDEYFLGLAREAAKRATCDRGRSGCVVVKDKRILTTGYVGSPTGLPHCDDVGHLMKSVDHGNGKVSQHCVRTNHAEENAIVQAARFGMALEGATLYSKMVPCFTCAKMIINAGIKHVVAEMRYHLDGDTMETLKQAGVQLDVINNEVEKYSNQ